MTVYRALDGLPDGKDILDRVIVEMDRRAKE